MPTLLLGLALFLGPHSVRVWGEGLRARLRPRLGEGPWRGTYSLLAVAGLVAITFGYGQAREGATWLWALPVGARHLASTLMLVAFVLLVAAYVPGNRVKAAVGHPMLAGTAVWAGAHLLANGTVADAVLFGAFLVWSVLAFVAARRRDAAARVRYPVGSPLRDALVVALGATLWVAFAFYLHRALFGVAPFGV